MLPLRLLSLIQYKTSFTVLATRDIFTVEAGSLISGTVRATVLDHWPNTQKQAPLIIVRCVLFHRFRTMLLETAAVYVHFFSSLVDRT